MYKPSYPHPLIAREGWPFIALSVVLALLLNLWSGWLALPFWLLAVFVIQFFRDPARTTDDVPNAVLAPADGRIVAVEEAHDPYADRAALKISVFMNVFNVHSNRMPVKGRVGAVTYFPGRFLNAALDKSSLENERNAVIVYTPDDQQLTLVQVAGLVARRILCYVDTDEPVYAGQRYGFIRFGSRVDVYLPLHARPRVALGDRVKATQTLLAELGPAPYVPTDD
ncbi:MAG: phosphatidylserine decarboxylase [Castellaniella sp.]